jgi:hypothetical protein
MRLSKNELLVIINPYVALDHNGMPVGVVIYDPLEGRPGETQFIGAKITKREVRRTDVQPKRGGAVRADRRRPRYASSVEHDTSAQRVPHTAHHIAAIESGSLIPANEVTAKIARVPFVEPAMRLDEARTAAIATWTRDHGAPPPIEAWPAHREATPSAPAQGGEAPAPTAAGAVAAPPALAATAPPPAAQAPQAAVTAAPTAATAPAPESAAGAAGAASDRPTPLAPEPPR